MRKFEELVAHSVVFIVMLVLYFETKNFPDMNIGGSLGAEWWPQLILLLGMFMTLASAGFVARKQFGGDSGKTKVNREEVISLGFSSAIFAAFLATNEVIGFVGAVPVLMVGFMLQLGARKIPTIILSAVLSSLGFAVIFGRLMEIPLPRGMGVARAFSYMLY